MVVPITSGVGAVALSAQEERIADAALRCIARWGTAKTTLDDVAREAGYSRATIYRFFPGGKDALIETVARREVDRFLTAVGDQLRAADDLEGSLVGAITEAARGIHGHAALQFLLAHEPETIVPRLAFTAMDAVLAVASGFAAPLLSPYLPVEEAERTAEWVTRIVLSYSLCPADGIDLTDAECVRRLVRSFVLPGLLAIPTP